MTNGTKTGLFDETGTEIAIGDRVELLDMVGTVTWQYGAVGITTDDHINWKAIQSAILPTTHHNEPLKACKNLNFISFWELCCNFKAMNSIIPNVKVLSKKQRLPKKLRTIGSNYNWTLEEIREAIVTQIELAHEEKLNLDTSRADAANEQAIIKWAHEMGYDAELNERTECVTISRRKILV